MAHLAYGSKGIAAMNEIDIRSEGRSVDLNITLAAQIADIVVVQGTPSTPTYSSRQISGSPGVKSNVPPGKPTPPSLPVKRL